MQKLYTVAVVVSHDKEMHTLIIWGVASSAAEMEGKARGMVAENPQLALCRIENIEVTEPPEWVASFYADQR